MIDLNSFLKVQISADRMQAYVSFQRITDDFSCSAQDLEQFLRSHMVVHGLQFNMLHAISSDPVSYYKKATIVAEGTAADPGIDGRIEMVQLAAKDEASSKEPQQDVVDFRQVLQLNNVRAGQLIARVIPPKAGTPGIDVSGAVVTGTVGKAARIKMGKNVALSEDKNNLYAVIDGLVSITDKDKINVFPVYEVNGDVDYHVGNIDFVGNVVIRGNVLAGFKVKAAGDIRVVGGVEGAELESLGSIEITGGIMAGGKGLVHAHKNVKCSFIQEGNVTAGEDIIVSQSIMHSNVRVGGSVVINGAKGLIVGGVTQAGDSVRARTIGNAMSTATVIEVGIKPHLRSELSELRVKLREMVDNNDKTDKALAILDQLAAAGQLTPDRLAMRVKLTATKRQIHTDLVDTKERIMEIERLLEDEVSARVDVIHTVYGGTKIAIGRYTKFIKDPVKRISFRYEEGDIAMHPISGA